MEYAPGAGSLGSRIVPPPACHLCLPSLPLPAPTKGPLSPPLPWPRMAGRDWGHGHTVQHWDSYLAGRGDLAGLVELLTREQESDTGGTACFLLPGAGGTGLPPLPLLASRTLPWEARTLPGHPPATSTSTSLGSSGGCHRPPAWVGFPVQQERRTRNSQGAPDVLCQRLQPPLLFC